MKLTKKINSRGQAMITVLYVVVIGLLVTTGAVFALMSNTSVVTIQSQGVLAHSAAESGVENALIRLIRNPSYTGETMIIDSNRIATVTASANPNIQILSVGSVGTVSRKISVSAHYDTLKLVVDSWNEVP